MNRPGIRYWLASLLLSMMAGSACSNANLGDIDESVDAREEMPGPGIFANSEGESSLTWSSESNDSGSATADSNSTSAQAEFEQFKLWNQLRSEGADSAEYREFLQWLEYRKFKAAQ